MSKTNTRRKHDATFKARVALEALKGQETMAQLSSRYGVHSGQISKWRQRVREGLPELFRSKNTKNTKPSDEALIASLYEQIGRLNMELEWFKKKSDGIF